MKTLFIASKNQHKIKEMAHMLEALDIQVRGVDELKDFIPVEETGKTFIENARLKAFALLSYLNTNKPDGVNLSSTYILADDSGLECHDLNGLPGVHSARFAGPNATDQENNAKLTQMISETTHLSRSAQYVCAMVLLFPDGHAKEIVETCQGRIVTVPKGSNGFGYDPYFYLEQFDKTMAEISLAEKNKISHRGKALKSLILELKKII